MQGKIPREYIKMLLSLKEKDLLRLLADDGDIRVSQVGQESNSPAEGPTSKSLGRQVFISYARLDVELASQLYEKLLAGGFKPWMDIKSLHPGEKFDQAIRRAIKQSEFVIICLSNNSVNRRGYIQKEIRVALEVLNGMLDYDIYLIPVRLEECKVPESLSDLQWLDLFDSAGYKQLISALHEGERRRCI